MVIVETSFPRGGTIKAKPRENEKEFGALQEKRKKEKHKKKSTSGAEITQEIKAVSAELLSHKTIQEGMIIMGIVKSVDPTFLKISLPGRIVGHVLASAVSDSYNKIMHKYVDGQMEGTESFKPLPELFEVGQVVYTKVMEISNTEKGRLNIKLSLKPADVHSSFVHQQLRKGQMFCGMVEEVQDHGYVIESGVNNLRCFLPYENSREGFNVGKMICLRIEKLTQTSSASTAVCKSIEGSSRRIKDLAEPNLDYILPSSVVNFTITKILKNGLQGTVMNGAFTGYVNEHQLQEPLQLPSAYSVNETVSARLLYVMPLTKLIYLSLRTSTDGVNEAVFKRGDLVQDATVHHVGTGGIVLDLAGKGKGLISFNSIKANYKGNYDQDEVMAKYKRKSRLKVRIMEFDMIDCLYTCSDNPMVVNEKFYTLGDLKPGEFVTGVVEQKDALGGYFIRIGNVRGLIEKMFLAATSGNLSEGAKVRCRVIWTNADRNIAYLTNRSEYMSNAAKVPTKPGDVKADRIFTGTIVKEQEKCYIVRFFANTKGILYKNRVGELGMNEMVSFYEGATMNFRIHSKEGEKIVIGLAEDMHKVGEICEAKVTNIIEQGLEVCIPGEEGDQVKGLVPVRLLSNFQEIVVGHLKTYHLEEQINVACVLKNLYSVRDVAEFQTNSVKQFKDINAGDILKGWVKNVEGDVIEVMLPIRGYDKLVKVHMNSFLERAISESNVVLVPDQVVYVKILSKEKFSKMVTISAKLTDVWDCQLRSTGELFAKFLEEVKTIRKRFKAQSKPIGYYSIGSKVAGKLVSLSKIDNDWIVELPNNVNGLIKAATWSGDKTLQVGKEVTCTILWVDYSLEVLYLTHKAADGNRICKGTLLPEKFKHQTGINAKVLLKTNEFVLCSLKKGENPLVYVPARLHFNDFENTTVASAKEGEICRLSFIHEKYPIAVFEKSWKFWKKMEKPKRKAESNSVHKEVPSKKAKVLKESGESGKCKFKEYTSLTDSLRASNDESDIEMGENYFIDTGKKRSKNDSRLLDRNNSDDDKESEQESSDENMEQTGRTDSEGEEIDEEEMSVNEDEEDSDEEVEDSEDEELNSDDGNELSSNEEDLENDDNAVKQNSDDEDTETDTEVEDNEEETENESDSDEDNCSENECEQSEEYEELEAGPIPNKSNKSHEKNTQEKLKESDRSTRKTMKTKPALPGANDFWSTDLTPQKRPTKTESESSDDENECEKTITKKKKKQTAAEKFKAAREEEARLRQIEEKYANPDRQPETADEFDRLVLANPNSSKTWISYMVFHLQAAEIDKARSIARKALKSISFREEQEIINIWVSLLNLELRYGSKDGFTEILKEATLCNDPYKIYSKCLQILADAKKVQELNELIPKVTKKFKDRMDIWKDAASAYFEVGLADRAKQMLHKALAALPQRDHINTIVTFANLNHKNDDKDTAYTLLDQIVTSYPKRVDVWAQYVDMLIKDKNIDVARRTLERAVAQKIPMKKMRTMFKKYLEFEEKYGNEETVQNVKQMAASYVKNEVGT